MIRFNHMEIALQRGFVAAKGDNLVGFAIPPQTRCFLRLFQLKRNF